MGDLRDSVKTREGLLRWWRAAVPSTDQRVGQPSAERLPGVVVTEIARRDAGQSTRMSVEEAHGPIAETNCDCVSGHVSFDERFPHAGETRHIEQASGAADSADVHPAINRPASQTRLARETGDPARQAL